MEKQILLSICIPTYNRSKKLGRALAAWRKAFDYYKRDNVELIVSDNCSTDETPLVIKDYLKIPYFRYYRNSENIGFNNNMFLLVDQYARGEYCWVIGDDDYVDHDCLEILIPLLKGNIKYISLNFRKYGSVKDYVSDTEKRRLRPVAIYRELTFVDAIDKNSSIDNVLATLMTTSVFLRTCFLEFPREIVSPNSSADFISTFPNSYIMLTQFGNSQATCINSPIFSIVEEKKEWTDKADLYFKVHLSQLYDHYCQIVGREYMDNTKNGKMMKAIRAKYVVRDELFKGKICWQTIKALFSLLSCSVLYIPAIKNIILNTFTKRNGTSGK
ncbi:MAG: glycosyltransferase family 2 protein [Prevotella sp.]|nr:glycosyltransferase family 2 protein [Prevotella sp.]